LHTEWKSGFPPGSLVSISRWINENCVLEWLKHFQNNRVTGPYFLIVCHSSHETLPLLGFHYENSLTAIPNHVTAVKRFVCIQRSRKLRWH
jgi:hypothetical protein